MVEKVYYVQSRSINPYHNLALQKYLFDNIPDNSMIFMLWKNNDTVILGNQQNAYMECTLSRFEIEHTYLARREMVGKAIFNDLGCLNFAFFLYQNNYNIINQVNVIYQALRQLGLPIYLDENSEIMLSSARITDSTYFTAQGKCIHSGTIYWDADKAKRGRLIRDDRAKSNIANITDFNQLVSLNDISKKVLQSLADRYGPVYQLSITDNFEELVEKYRSLQYIYQTDKKYTLILNDHFENGHMVLYVDMLRNYIMKIDVYMDNEDFMFIDSLQRVLAGMVVDDATFKRRIFHVDEQYGKDIIKIYELIKKESYNI